MNTTFPLVPMIALLTPACASASSIPLREPAVIEAPERARAREPDLEALRAVSAVDIGCAASALSIEGVSMREGIAFWKASQADRAFVCTMGEESGTMCLEEPWGATGEAPRLTHESEASPDLQDEPEQVEPFSGDDSTRCRGEAFPTFPQMVSLWFWGQSTCKP